MVQQLKYACTLKTIPYLYLDVKKAARLKLQGVSEQDIITAALDENIFQVNTQKRKREIASTVIRRIQVLDSALLERLVNGNIETGKQIVLYTILKTDRLFCEFMKEVFREKILLRDELITDRDFSVFFKRKIEQDDVLATWKDYTFYKLKQVYKRILSEAGFIVKQSKQAKIIRPMMEEEVIKIILEAGDKAYLEAMLGEI